MCAYNLTLQNVCTHATLCIGTPGAAAEEGKGVGGRRLRCCCLNRSLHRKGWWHAAAAAASIDSNSSVPDQHKTTANYSGSCERNPTGVFRKCMSKHETIIFYCLLDEINGSRCIQSTKS